MLKTLQTQTNEQCAEWLTSRGLVGDPYHRTDASGVSYVQIPLAPAARRTMAKLRHLVLLAGPFQSALLHVTDWSLFSADEMEVITGLRIAAGDERALIETPGHLYDSGERDLLIGMMGLVAAYGWTAYVYFDHGLTLLLCEGEYVDVWDTNGTRFQKVSEEFV